MAITRTSSNGAGFRLVHFFLYASLLITLANFVWALYTVRGYKREFTIDERLFNSSVSAGISNFLSSVLIPTNSAPVSRPVYPEVKVSDYCFYSDIWGSNHIVYNGVEYSAGDFCEFGLIRLIEDNGFYCENSDGLFTIIKRQTLPVVTPPRGASDARAEEDARQDGAF